MSPFLLACTQTALVVIGIACALCLYRVVVGPSVPDRVAALDLMTILSVGWMACLSVATQCAWLSDPAIMLGLVSFLATAAFARYLERKL
jgi:multicomponent Na+:H+ antiporter subunit F